MPLHTPSLTLAPDAAIDLQLHTRFSDGNWSAEELLDYVAGAGFALVAVTDHDRVDTVAEVRRIGAAKGMPVPAAAELSATWEGRMLDLLCYGFDPQERGPLAILAAATARLPLPRGGRGPGGGCRCAGAPQRVDRADEASWLC